MTKEERKEAIGVLENAKNFAYNEEYTKAFDLGIEALEQQPREHGEWRETGEIIFRHKGALLFECQCSKCKGLAYFRKESLKHKLVGADFCPCCGADMRGE